MYDKVIWIPIDRYLFVFKFFSQLANLLLKKIKNTMKDWISLVVFNFVCVWQNVVY